MDSQGQATERGMAESAVKEAVFKILRKIAPEADLDELAANENLREALDIDSFDFLNLIIGLHEQLKVEIPETDYGKLRTLGEFVSYICNRVK